MITHPELSEWSLFEVFVLLLTWVVAFADLSDDRVGAMLAPGIRLSFAGELEHLAILNFLF